MGLSADQLAKLEELAFQIISGAVQAAPIIIADVNASLPYVNAITDLIKAGGQPTNEAWAAVRARLDEGSSMILRKAQEAQDQIDQFSAGGTT